MSLITGKSPIPLALKLDSGFSYQRIPTAKPSRGKQLYDEPSCSVPVSFLSWREIIDARFELRLLNNAHCLP